MNSVAGVRGGQMVRALIAATLVLAIIFLGSLGQLREQAPEQASSPAVSLLSLVAGEPGEPVRKCMPGGTDPGVLRATAPVPLASMDPGSNRNTGITAHVPAVSSADPALDRTPPTPTHLDLGICRT